MAAATLELPFGFGSGVSNGERVVTLIKHSEIKRLTSSEVICWSAVYIDNLLRMNMFQDALVSIRRRLSACHNILRYFATKGCTFLQGESRGAMPKVEIE